MGPGFYMCHFDLIFWLMAINVCLSLAHAFLGWLAPRTHGIWDDRLVKVIESIQWALEQIMASRTRKK